MIIAWKIQIKLLFEAYLDVKHFLHDGNRQSGIKTKLHHPYQHIEAETHARYTAITQNIILVTAHTRIEGNKDNGMVIMDL